jgi:hypothetical protein
MRRAVASWLLVLNVALLVATSRPARRSLTECEVVPLEPQAFEASADGGLLLGIVAAGGMRIHGVRGEIVASDCAATVEIAGEVLDVASDPADTGALPIVFEVEIDDAVDVEVRVTACPDVVVETALEVHACSDRGGVVTLERR